MNKFKNKTEQDFWVECVRHAERLNEIKGSISEAKWHKNDYVEYADKMLKEFREKQTNISPNDGGCWFCHTKSGNMVFDTEFDTYVHVACIRKALKKNSNDPEAKLMKYLLK